MATGKGGGKSRASKLPAKVNARRNTKTGRKAMSASNFGVPDKRKYRIDDAPHARDALGRVSKNGTPAEKAQVRQRVAKKYPSINVTGLPKKSGKGK
jgi:hypothetical protein